MAISLSYEVIGNMHMHTPYSDGAGSHAEIAEAALTAGLDFVIVTDHNVLVHGVEGYYGDEQRGHVLLLTGEEIHDQLRNPQVNHLLVYGAQQELAQCANNPQTLIDAVKAANGLCFLAHPTDPPLKLIGEGEIPWVDWQVERYTGLEIWNFMSSVKGFLTDIPTTLRNVFRPEDAMIGPYPDALALWDQMTAAGKRIVGIGNADAHATVFQVGPLKHTVYPYDFLFSCVNTHVLLPQPLTGEVAKDQVAIYKALGQGNAFIGYDIPGSSKGFRFSASSQYGTANMGGTLRLGSGATIQTLASARAHIKLLCNSKVVAEVHDRENLTYTAHAGGAYRAEVWRDFKGTERCWILSNPIYIEDANYIVQG